MKLKVCGMTDAYQITQLCELGADYIGLIFYEKSPRYCANKLPPKELIDVPTSAKLTGVFVNENIETIKKRIEDYRLSAVQLCGNESPDVCNELQQFAEVLKVIHIGDSGLPEKSVSHYRDAVDYFLFDTRSDKYGGSGLKFNWQNLSGKKMAAPFFLSGGISATDVSEIKNFVHPQFYGVDINSRFETEPGIKDIFKIKNFINQLQS